MRADIIDNRALEVGDLEVPSFTIDGLLDTIDLVVLESAMTRLDVVDAGLPKGHYSEACAEKATNSAQLLLVVHGENSTVIGFI